ncbi:hypothetical protein [Aureitalea marina]|uniref:Uncharacterized protein n=1 Tax=Aureitalea marina TaxID=930804 RepID=A0A2S7KSW1_9FLAO|nr:hypothetical protein [Aureitalea marina]PQB05719.1 hypothetical protein BST85_13030 [Aureitalea marina]
MIGIPLRILLLLVSYIIVRITRAKLFKKLNQLMMAESEKAAAMKVEEERVPEKPLIAPLKIREMDASTELSEAKSIREEAVAQAEREFNRTIFDRPGNTRSIYFDSNDRSFLFYSDDRHRHVLLLWV